MQYFQEHQVNNRLLSTFHHIDKELELDLEKNYLFDLSYQGLIKLSGEKAKEFLQGQLTCDMNQLSDIQMIQGAQCNLKGRILSLLDIIQWKEIQLILPKDLIESTLSSLNKTAQLARVTLTAAPEWSILGFYLQNPKDLLPNTSFFPKQSQAFCQESNWCYYHLGNGYYLFVLPLEQAAELTQVFIKQDQLLGSLTWHTLRLFNKQIDIYPESRGLFLPHRIELHKTNLVSFNKGCYKGQEIIARTHYRATLKHEFKLFTISSETPLASGQKLFMEDSQTEVGEIIDYSFFKDDLYLIAVSILKEPIDRVRIEGQEPIRQLISVGIGK